MKRTLFSVIMLLGMAFSTVAQSGGILRVAILDPTISGSLGDDVKLAIREIIGGAMVNYGNYTILERSLLDKVIRESKFSNSDAVDDSQATELGKLAGAQKVIVSVVSQVGGKAMLSIKMIDVESATVERQKAKVTDYDTLLDEVEPLTLALMGKAVDAKPHTAKPKSSTPQKNTAPKATPKAAPKATPKVETRKATEWGAPLKYNDYAPEKFIAEDLIPLLDQDYMNVQFNFSKASVAGMSYYDLTDEAGRQLMNAQREAMRAFVQKVNNKLKLLQLNNTKRVRYTLYVDMLSFGPKGCSCNYIIEDNQAGKVVGMISLDTDRKSNDAVFKFQRASTAAIEALTKIFENAGDKFGSILKDELERAAKIDKKNKKKWR